MNFKYFIILFFLIYNHSVSGQDVRRNINLEVRYPIPIGNNYINDNYSGLFDLGIDYNLFLLPFLNAQCGIKIHTSFLNMRNSNIDLIIFEPKFKYEYYKWLNDKVYFMSNTAIGYSFWHPKDIATNNRQSGLNIELQSKLLIETKTKFRYYFFIAYEFTKFNKKKSILDTKYYRNAHLLYPGIGFEIKLTKK